MSVKFSNNAVTTLTDSPSAGATSFNVASASAFPTLASGDWTYVSLTSEVVKVTAISGTTFTCDATSNAHASGESVELRMTAEILNDVALGDDESLDAISNASAITGNAVDVFIYDTSNDSDGGAWRKRTQATSWYNETLNTATRGSRKEFPSVAVIVATTTTVTIYDGDTPDLDMWMVFNSGGGSFSNHMLLGPSGTISGVKVVNGILAVCKISGGHSLVLLDFIKESSEILRLSNDAGLRGFHSTKAFSERNVLSGEHNGTLRQLVSNIANDVAMTVLPNAPIDSTTGLPIPTIAVATDGGVSVIKDDGTVVDITANAGASYNGASFIDIDDNYNLIFEQDSNGRSLFYIPIPSADRTTVTSAGSPTDKRMLATISTSNGLPKLNGSDAQISISGKGNDQYVYAGTGITSYIYGASDANSSVAYLTSTYNSGYMTGDIKGAWLSDTDTTNVVGTELVTNGTFDTDISGWTNSSTGTGTVTWNAGGYVELQAANQSNVGRITQDITTVIGSSYTFSVERLAGSTNNVIMSTSGSSIDPLVTGVNTLTLTASSTTTTISIWQYFNGTSFIDNISVRIADSDRSVNNNGLQVNGTITKTAVATGADLVAYSGFNSTNYLEQPYNADLDFGTGDFSIMGWYNVSASGILVERGNRGVSNTPGFYLWSNGSNTLRFETSANNFVTTFRLDGTLVENVWQYVTALRRSGVMYLYINGVLQGTLASTVNLTNTTAITAFGVASDGSVVLSGSLALWRISATAPTAAQIKEIYEAEKPLFQENAKCTLNGTSDAVQCLAYDDSTSELVVGTSSSLSVFKGLRRVDEELGNFTEVSQQGGMRITEKA